MPKISDRFVKSASEPGEYRDDHLKGFCLRIRASGEKTKKIKKIYTVHGRIKGGATIRHTIGEHGSPWDADTAREEAEETLRMMRKGIDPRAVHQELRQADVEKRAISTAQQRAKQLTLKYAFEEFEKAANNTKDSTKELYKWVLFKHLEDWLDKPLNDITEDMVRKRYRQLTKQTISSANNCMRALRRLFNWASKQTGEEYRDSSGKSLIASNPVTVLKDEDERKGVDARTWRIKDGFLPAWYEAVCKLADETVKDYFIFLLVTGLRSEEAAKLKWSDVDLNEKHFTARDTKNGTDHQLPLTDFTLKMLKERKSQSKQSKYVFPALDKIKSTHGHIGDVRRSEGIITRELTSKGIVTTAEDPNYTPDKDRKNYTPHALRRTFTMAAARNVTESQRKNLVNHKSKSNVIDEHYTDFTYEELREPLERVEAFLLRLMSIEEGKESKDNVVSLKKKRA